VSNVSSEKNKLKLACYYAGGPLKPRTDDDDFQCPNA
jgi:hypothetical protein